MLDAIARPYIAPSLDKVAEKIETLNIPVNIITLGALGVGLIGCFFVAIHSYMFGLIFIVGSRVLAGVDGAIARRTGGSDFGAYLDRVCDYIFYAAFVFFFVLTSQTHYLAGLFLIFAYVGMAVSHLVHLGIAEKRGRSAPSGGLIGHSEIIIFMVLACLFPASFSAMAFLFGLLCFGTIVMNMMQAWRNLSPIEQNYDDAESIP